MRRERRMARCPSGRRAASGCARFAARGRRPKPTRGTPRSPCPGGPCTGRRIAAGPAGRRHDGCTWRRAAPGALTANHRQDRVLAMPLTRSAILRFFDTGHVPPVALEHLDAAIQKPAQHLRGQHGFRRTVAEHAALLEQDNLTHRTRQLVEMMRDHHYGGVIGAGSGAGRGPPCTRPGRPCPVRPSAHPAAGAAAPRSWPGPAALSSVRRWIAERRHRSPSRQARTTRSPPRCGPVLRRRSPRGEAGGSSRTGRWPPRRGRSCARRTPDCGMARSDRSSGGRRRDRLGRTSGRRCRPCRSSAIHSR